MARRPGGTTLARPWLWQRLRDPFEAWFQSWPLPRINPDIISYLSIGMAFLFVVAVSVDLPFVAWVFLVVHVMLDGIDGAIATKHRLRRTAAQKRHGQLVDVVSDRFSEFIIFSYGPFVTPWFYGFLVNIPLSVVTVRTHRAYIWPLRQLFLVVYTLSLLF